jgi:predicted TIM-barrel fold metal-dependent hydrolase
MHQSIYFDLPPIRYGAAQLENEKEMDSLTSVCCESDLPLLLHCNEPVGHYYPGKTDTSLRQIETFVTNNPKLKIILAHLGGGLLFYETMSEIKEKFINVYYDTAAVPFLYDERIYRTIGALGLCEKILFGSDFPLLSPSHYMSAIEAGGLTEKEKQGILGENARFLINLKLDNK